MGSCISQQNRKEEAKGETPAKKEEKSTTKRGIPALTPERLVGSNEELLPSSMPSISPAASPKRGIDYDRFGPPQRACFGAGCYWGTEKYFRHNFAKKFPQLGQIVEGAVGFMGPETAPANPSYRDVCSGATGHVEVYDFEFVGGDAYYEELVKYFFQFHDPTTLNRQGNDRGTQYASVIYCYTDRQFEIATKVKDQLQQLLNKRILKCYQSSIAKTDIRRSTIFYPAHKEHQDYLMVNPNGYCNHRIRFEEWPSLLQTASDQ